MTSQQVLNTGSMNLELAQSFTALHYQLMFLWLKHKQYCELFDSGSERVSLLNETAPAFFHIAAESMASSVMLDLSAMTDPPKSIGHANLTIRLLPPLVNNPKDRTDIQKLVDVAVGAVTATVRPWRDKRLAHHDLALSTGNFQSQLPLVIEPHINTALVRGFKLEVQQLMMSWCERIPHAVS